MCKIGVDCIENSDKTCFGSITANEEIKNYNRGRITPAARAIPKIGLTNNIRNSRYLKSPEFCRFVDNRLETKIAKATAIVPVSNKIHAKMNDPASTVQMFSENKDKARYANFMFPVSY